MIYQNISGVDELDDEETRILLEKEFDDFYEDQVHKSAGKRRESTSKWSKQVLFNKMVFLWI